MKQTVTTCPEHGATCEVIYLHDENGVQVWESHAPSDSHVGCRIGDHLPECEDLRTGEVHKFCEMCDDCKRTFLVS